MLLVDRITMSDAAASGSFKHEQDKKPWAWMLLACPSVARHKPPQRAAPIAWGILGARHAHDRPSTCSGIGRAGRKGGVDVLRSGFGWLSQRISGFGRLTHDI